MFETIHPVTHNSFSNTDLNLDSSPDFNENNNLPSALSSSQVNSEFVDTGSTMYTTAISGKPTSCSEKLTNSSSTAHRPPLLPKSVAPSVIPHFIHNVDRFGSNPVPFPLTPPPITKIEAKKSKFYKHRKYIDSTFSCCDKPIPPILKC